MELQNRQQEGRWQSGSLGHTNISLNRQPEMHRKRWAMNGSLIRINTFSFHYIKCYDLLKFNHCCLAQERRQFRQEHSHDCGGIGVSPSWLDCQVEKHQWSTQSPHLTSALCHPLHIPSPKMKCGTHQCHQIWWYSMPSHPRPSSSTKVPCQHHGHPFPAPENSHIHQDANCICVHCCTR